MSEPRISYVQNHTNKSKYMQSHLERVSVVSRTQRKNSESSRQRSNTRENKNEEDPRRPREELKENVKSDT